MEDLEQPLMKDAEGFASVDYDLVLVVKAPAGSAPWEDLVCRLAYAELDFVVHELHVERPSLSRAGSRLARAGVGAVVPHPLVSKPPTSSRACLPVFWRCRSPSLEAAALLWQVPRPLGAYVARRAFVMSYEPPGVEPSSPAAQHCHRREQCAACLLRQVRARLQGHRRRGARRARRRPHACMHAQT